ncbi:MAG: serine protease, partial [Clostridia bacterium]|nr:serine protease [Clostridia bacterium]
MKVFLRAISTLLVLLIAISLCGCNSDIKVRNLMQNIKPSTALSPNNIRPQNVRMTDFALRLFRATEKKNENTLISPLSVISALGMTANGAEKETLLQMEAVFGMTSDELNLYLNGYMKKLPYDEQYKLSLANSIWFNEDARFTVNTDFLQRNADYYGADVFEAAFDRETLRDINNWVKKNTDGMIPKILDEIPDFAVMYLVNALAFEAEWSEIYEKHQVRSGDFIKADGTKQKVEFMYGSEWNYLED